MNRIATECACRLTEDALHKGIDHLIILTSAMDSDAVRRAVGTVKRYGDHRPAYQHRVSMNICNGGRVISKQEAQDVERWYEGGSKVVPFMGA